MVSRYGVGIPLLFQFVRFSLICYFWQFLLTGIITFVLSIINFEERGVGIYLITDRLSVANIWREQVDDFGAEEWAYLSLTIICTLSQIVLNYIYQVFLERMVVRLDEVNITDSDFSLMMTNLPHSMTKREIKEFIVSRGIEESEIIYINMCYKFDNLNKLFKKEEKTIIYLKQLEHFRERIKREGVPNPETFYPPAG